MNCLKFVVTEGKPYLWKDILTLRRMQLAAIEAAKATQLALFETLHDDRRPTSECTTNGRYLQPSLFENGVRQ